MRPRLEVVEAMEILLTPRQVEWILGRTFAGPSRVQVLQRLVTLGIVESERRRAIEYGDTDGIEAAVVSAMMDADLR